MNAILNHVRMELSALTKSTRTNVHVHQDLQESIVKKVLLRITFSLPVFDCHPS